MMASLRVVLEALQACPCDIFIETMGVGFTYPLVKLLFGPLIVPYVHYPLLSSDMINVAASG